MNEKANDNMKTFDIELPPYFADIYFGEGISNEELVAKIEKLLVDNIKVPQPEEGKEFIYGDLKGLTNPNEILDKFDAPERRDIKKTLS